MDARKIRKFLKYENIVLIDGSILKDLVDFGPSAKIDINWFAKRLLDMEEE